MIECVCAFVGTDCLFHPLMIVNLSGALRFFVMAGDPISLFFGKG